MKFKKLTTLKVFYFTIIFCRTENHSIVHMKTIIIPTVIGIFVLHFPIVFYSWNLLVLYKWNEYNFLIFLKREAPLLSRQITPVRIHLHVAFYIFRITLNYWDSQNWTHWKFPISPIFFVGLKITVTLICKS